jgi:hypoxanthine phosphoribosyltransferase
MLMATRRICSEKCRYVTHHPCSGARGVSAPADTQPAAARNDPISDIITGMGMPEPTLGDILLNQDQIRERLSELAAAIDADYAGRDLVLLGVLKGAMMAMADLARMLAHNRVEIDWITVSSYGDRTSSSGVIRMLREPDLDLAGRNVLVVDDITDSGLTLSWLVANLGSRGAASVEIFSLLRKPDLVKVEVPLRYLGFDIPPDFVAGYGMDYAQRYRNLPYIARLNF